MHEYIKNFINDIYDWAGGIGLNLTKETIAAVLSNNIPPGLKFEQTAHMLEQLKERPGHSWRPSLSAHIHDIATPSNECSVILSSLNQPVHVVENPKFDSGVELITGFIPYYEKPLLALIALSNQGYEYSAYPKLLEAVIATKLTIEELECVFYNCSPGKEQMQILLTLLAAEEAASEINPNKYSKDAIKKRLLESIKPVLLSNNIYDWLRYYATLLRLFYMLPGYNDYFIAKINKELTA